MGGVRSQVPAYTDTVIETMSCDITVNGFTPEAGYVVGPSGEQLTEVDANNNWVHTNVYAGGKQIGTYDVQGLHIYIDDPLGTRRVQVGDITKTVEASYQSLPFGDGFTAIPVTTSDDPTENHFTGKERDTESGNDYFGARYYNSAVGRFMSPDWSASEDPVPYANLSNPQSLNLYAYVQNNPLYAVDSDGHDGCTAEGMPIDCGEVNSEAFTQCPNNQCTDSQGSPFVAGAGGAQGYVSYSDPTGAFNEWGGQFANDQQFAADLEQFYQMQIAQPAYQQQLQVEINQVAAYLGIDTGAAATLINTNTSPSNKNRPTMKGGNWNFAYNLSLLDPAQASLLETGAREPGSPSLHLHNPSNGDPPYSHNDTADPYSASGGLSVSGLLKHFYVDIFLGNTVYSATGIPRP